MITCENNRPCPCTFDCPGCFFSPEAEATYDRSIEALARDTGMIK